MKDVIKNIGNLIVGLLYRCMWIFKIDDKKIVSVSYFGKGYGDSGKYICDELHNRKKDYRIIWLANNTDGVFPEYIKPVKYNSIRAFYELATAKVWIDNSRKKLYITKRKKQYYLQTWHSNLRLKKIEKDAENYLTKRYIKRCKKDSKMANAIIAGCDFSYDTIRRAFWYDGPIYKTGIPRCDELFSIKTGSIEKTKNKLGLDSHAKIILYAPTFRKTGDINLDGIEGFINDLKENDNNYVLLVRFHPISKQRIEETEDIKDATNYPNMQELINAADILVTDYSGSMFDAAISHKKCVLFTPDYEEYLKKERELYFNLDELPFENTHTLDELKKAIINLNESEINKKIDAFLKRIGCYEKGESAKNVVDLLEEKVWSKNV